jgi:hypothetical protein
MDTVDQIRQAALKLSEIDRLELAKSLLNSVLKDRRSAAPQRGEMPSEARLTVRSDSPPPAPQVPKPVPGPLRYVFKVDASYNTDRKVAGIGIVIYAADASTKRDRNFKEIERISEAYSCVPARLPEKLAILRALQIASARGYSTLEVWSDCSSSRQMATRAMNGGGDSALDGVGKLILQSARTFEKLSFPPFERRNNVQAHRLAREGLRRRPPVPWPESDGGLPPVAPERFELGAPSDQACQEDAEVPF